MLVGRSSYGSKVSQTTTESLQRLAHVPATYIYATPPKVERTKRFDVIMQAGATNEKLVFYITSASTKGQRKNGRHRLSLVNALHAVYIYIYILVGTRKTTKMRFPFLHFFSSQMLGKCSFSQKW